MTGQNDLYSPTAIRIMFAIIAAGAAGAAVFLTHGWFDWLLTTIAVVTGCAAIMPRLRRTR